MTVMTSTKKSKKNDSNNSRDLTGIPVPARDLNPGIENRPGSRSRPGAS